MVSIGKCPTFDGSKRTVEVHIIGFNKNIYGHELKTDIIKRLRGEICFSCPEDLKKQVSDDIENAKTIFNSFG